MKRITWAEALEKALITTGVVLVGIWVVVGIIAFLNPHPGNVFSDTLDKLKLVLLGVLVIVFGFSLFFFKYARDYVGLGLFLLSALVFLASFNNVTISQTIRDSVASIFDINYLSLAVVLAALSFAVISITRYRAAHGVPEMEIPGQAIQDIDDEPADNLRADLEADD